MVHLKSFSVRPFIPGTSIQMNILLCIHVTDPCRHLTCLASQGQPFKCRYCHISKLPFSAAPLHAFASQGQPFPSDNLQSPYNMPIDSRGNHSSEDTKSPCDLSQPPEYITMRFRDPCDRSQLPIYMPRQYHYWRWIDLP
jgi:hypothetical protein